MTNNIKAFDFQGVKVKKDANTKLIRLTAPSTIVDLTLHNTANNSNYSVPSGKKATIIFVNSFQHNDSSRLVYANNADGRTGAVTLLDPGLNNDLTDLLFISIEIPALKFINVNVFGGTHSVMICHVVEENV